MRNYTTVRCYRDELLYMCNKCGALVTSATTHNIWHESQRQTFQLLSRRITDLEQVKTL